jgi:hypothetical protein
MATTQPQGGKGYAVMKHSTGCQDCMPTAPSHAHSIHIPLMPTAYTSLSCPQHPFMPTAPFHAHSTLSCPQHTHPSHAHITLSCPQHPFMPTAPSHAHSTLSCPQHTHPSHAHSTLSCPQHPLMPTASSHAQSTLSGNAALLAQMQMRIRVCAKACLCACRPHLCDFFLFACVYLRSYVRTKHVITILPLFLC